MMNIKVTCRGIIEACDAISCSLWLFFDRIDPGVVSSGDLQYQQAQPVRLLSCFDMRQVSPAPVEEV